MAGNRAVEFGWAVRTRTVRGSFWTDETVSGLAPIARLVLIGLFSVADREGRFPNRPGKIGRLLFPSDGIDIEATMHQLRAAGFLIFYEADGQSLVQVRNFARFQNIHPQEAKSILPGPDEQTQRESQSDLTRIQVGSQLDPTVIRGESRSEPSEPSEPSGTSEPSTKRSAGEGGPGGEPDSPPEAAPIDPGKKPKAERKKPARPMPEATEPNDTHRRLAALAGVNLETEIAKFRDHHAARDSRFASWDAALCTWLRNAKDFKPRSPPPRVNELPGRERRRDDDPKLGAPSGARARGWCPVHPAVGLDANGCSRCRDLAQASPA